MSEKPDEKHALQCAAHCVVRYFIGDDQMVTEEEVNEVTTKHLPLIRLVAYQLENAISVVAVLAEEVDQREHDKRIDFYQGM